MALPQVGAPPYPPPPPTTPPHPHPDLPPPSRSQVLLHLVTSPTLRPTVATPALTQRLAGFLAAASAADGATAPGLEEFRGALLHVLEALCQQTEVVLGQRQAMLGALLPALCSVVAQPQVGGRGGGVPPRGHRPLPVACLVPHVPPHPLGLPRRGCPALP